VLPKHQFDAMPDAVGNGGAARFWGTKARPPVVSWLAALLSERVMPTRRLLPARPVEELDACFVVAVAATL
jgi:hypothetical protein